MRSEIQNKLYDTSRWGCPLGFPLGSVRMNCDGKEVSTVSGWEEANKYISRYRPGYGLRALEGGWNGLG